jgi:hypothetical protein
MGCQSITNVRDASFFDEEFIDRCSGRLLATRFGMSKPGTIGRLANVDIISGTCSIPLHGWPIV